MQLMVLCGVDLMARTSRFKLETGCTHILRIVFGHHSLPLLLLSDQCYILPLTKTKTKMTVLTNTNTLAHTCTLGMKTTNCKTGGLTHLKLLKFFSTYTHAQGHSGRAGISSCSQSVVKLTSLFLCFQTYGVQTFASSLSRQSSMAE